MVGRKVIFLAFLFCFSFSKQLEIKADNFSADEKKMVNILSGSVLVKSNEDVLRSDKLLIFTDKNNKPLKYVASGNASFKILIKDKFYTGSANELIYYATNDIYEANGNAYIQDLSTNNKLYGNKISIDKKKQSYTVFGLNNKKPARFIFNLKEDFK